MSAWHLGIDLIVTFIVASLLLYNYGNWYRHHIIVTLAVLVAWYFSFIIIFVLPIDISDALYRQCLNTTSAAGLTNITNITSSTVSIVSFQVGSNNMETCHKPDSYVGDEVLRNLWRVVYWTSQFLTWLVLPLMQSYTQAGEFSTGGKLKSALLDNAIYYGSYMFICAILLIYIVTKPSISLEWRSLKAIASSASNTWGLFLLVFMLGYGLVCMPKEMYYRSLKSYSLNKAYFKVAKLNGERLSAEESVDDILELLGGCIKFDQERRPRRKYQSELDAILSLVPVELRERMQRRNVEAMDHDLKYLVSIHKKFKRSLMSFNRSEALYKIQINKTIDLEDVERCFDLRVFQRTCEVTETFVWKTLGPRFEWVWKCFLWRWLLFAASLVGAGFSLLLIWSEATFFVKEPKLSIFAHLISYDYGMTEFLCLMGILYLAACTYYTVFKIRFFNYYYLAGGHLTDEYSLIFAGMLLCRLTPPLCLNFLGLTHMDPYVIKSQEQETMYTNIMGHMEVLSIISNGFNVYFPVGILIVSLLTWFRVGSRLLNMLGIEQFRQFLADDELSVELVGEGRDIVTREKRRLLRNIENQKRLAERGSQQAAQEANRWVRNVENLEDTRISSQGRAYGSPDSTSRLQYNPPRGLFDDV